MTEPRYATDFDPFKVDLWEHEEESTVAARADRWTAEQTLAAYRAQFGISPEDSWYCGTEVYNMPEQEGAVGRRRRVHVVSSDPSRKAISVPGDA